MSCHDVLHGDLLQLCRVTAWKIQSYCSLLKVRHVFNLIIDPALTFCPRFSFLEFRKVFETSAPAFAVQEIVLCAVTEIRPRMSCRSW